MGYVDLWGMFSSPFPTNQTNSCCFAGQDGMFGEPPLTYMSKNGWWGEPVQFFVQHINNCQQLGHLGRTWLKRLHCTVSEHVSVSEGFSWFSPSIINNVAIIDGQRGCIFDAVCKMYTYIIFNHLYLIMFVHSV